MWTQFIIIFAIKLLIVSLYNFQHVNPLTIGSSYPTDQTASEACGPISSIIKRNDLRFNSLVYNKNPNLTFSSNDSRYMSQRLQNELDELWLRVQQRQVDFSNEQSSEIVLEVILAWIDTDGMDIINIGNESLHYEGRSARISIRGAFNEKFELLSDLSISAGFNYVYYPLYQDYIVVAVVKDTCSTSLDLLLILDGSGSVGVANFRTSLQFISKVTDFFAISPEDTHIAVIEYSTDINQAIHFNDYDNRPDLKRAIENINYSKGATYTYKVIEYTYKSIFTLANGMREKSSGIPRVAVFITDGISNGDDIDPYVEELHRIERGIEVYSIGIGDRVDFRELEQIAGAGKRVFELKQFNDTLEFVNRISYTSCETPATVNEFIETDVKQGEFRYFQAVCEFLAKNVTIENINLIGNSYLYVSNRLRNPGPLSNSTLVQKIENSNTIKLITINVSQGVDQGIVYISVQGREERNEFILYIYDFSIFEEIAFNVAIKEGVPIGYNVITLEPQIPLANFSLSILNRGNDSAFWINNVTGQVYTNISLNHDETCYYQLFVFAQNNQVICHRGKTTVNVAIINVNDYYPDFIGEPYLAIIDEDYGIGKLVLNLSAIDNDSAGNCRDDMTNYGIVTYQIVAGNDESKYSIDSFSGLITVAGRLDALIKDYYELIVRITDGGGFSNETSVKIRVKLVPAKPSFFKKPENFILNDTGSEVILYCQAEGRPQPEITWKFNNKLINISSHRIDTANPFQLRLRNVNLRDEGIYSCSVNNTSGTIIANGIITFYDQNDSVTMHITNFTNASSPEVCQIFHGTKLQQYVNDLLKQSNIKISEISTTGKQICDEACLCKNGGYCKDGECVCVAGWEGVVCSIDINECNRFTNACPKNIDCGNDNGSYMCNCPPNRSGRACKLLNQCYAGKCEQYKFCTDTEHVYVCVDFEESSRITTVKNMSLQEIFDLVSGELAKKEFATERDCKIYVESLNNNSREFFIMARCLNQTIFSFSAYTKMCRRLYNRGVLHSCLVGQEPIIWLVADPIDIIYKFFAIHPNGTHLNAIETVTILNYYNIVSELDRLGISVHSITPMLSEEFKPTQETISYFIFAIPLFIFCVLVLLFLIIVLLITVAVVKKSLSHKQYYPNNFKLKPQYTTILNAPCTEAIDDLAQSTTNHLITDLPTQQDHENSHTVDILSKPTIYLQENEPKFQHEK